jgi:hypothetical protein
MKKITPIVKVNPVAKNAHKFNKDMVHEDKKVKYKKGHRKHKTDLRNDSESND